MSHVCERPRGCVSHAALVWHRLTVGRMTLAVVAKAMLGLATTMEVGSKCCAHTHTHTHTCPDAKGLALTSKGGRGQDNARLKPRPWRRL